MAAVNVKAMDLPSLVALRAEIDGEIAAKQASAAAEFLTDMRERAAALGLKLSDLVDVKRSALRGGAKAAPRFRNPNDATQTWAGRGKKPKWVQEHLDAGGELSALAIEPEGHKEPRRGKRKQDD